MYTSDIFINPPKLKINTTLIKAANKENDQN